MRLILVRHGQAYHNIEHRVAGLATCKGLTEKGQQQVEAVAQRLAAENLQPDVFLTSPIKRAQQSAAIISEAIDTAPTTDDALMEFHPGEADGALASDLELFDMTVERDRPLSPGGESWNTFSARIVGAVERYATQYEGQTILAVTHGGVIACTILELFNIPRPGPWLHNTNSGITEWTYTPDRHRQWQLNRFNDAAHL